MINEKSRRNVWWKCGKCGYEWKSVVNARIKGTVCPVCADRAVLTGHNDLATTDAYLLSEWDYERNRVSSQHISRHSLQGVWWKCSFGHSWKAKIAERTIEKTGCKVCEREYLNAFPKLAVMFYAGQKQLRVQSDCAEVLGIPLEMYILEEKVAIETFYAQEKTEILKKHLCEKRNIKLLKIPYKIGDDEVEFAGKIKKALRSVHIFITSDERQDTEFIRNRFYEWRRRSSE